MWDRLRPALAPAPSASSPSGPASLLSAHQQTGQLRLPENYHHDHPLSPTTVTAPATVDRPRRTIPSRQDSRTLSLLQPLFSKQTSTAGRTISPPAKVDRDFDLLTGLGIDQSPTTRRYEIRRGVAHRVDLSNNDQQPPSSPESSTSGSPLKPKSANVATRHDYRSNVAEISPPSSPDVAASRNVRRQCDNEDVSPIDETSPEISQLEIAKAHHRRYLEEQQQQQQQMENQAPSPSSQAQQRSFIPTMRREKRQNQQASAATNLRETRSRERLRNMSATRWDDLTGEPTRQTTGRAGQVRPHEFANEITQATQAHQLPTPEPRQNRNAPQSFGDRVRKLRPGDGGARKEDASRPTIYAPMEAPIMASAVDQRPGWRGASGRTTLVAPVTDNTNVPPLNIPRKSSKRVPSNSGLARVPVGSPPVQPPTASSHVTPADSRHPETAPAAHSAPDQAMANSQRRQLPNSPATQSSQDVARAYPSPPMSGHDPRLSVHASPTHTPTANPADSGGHALCEQSTPILKIPDQEKAIRRKPPAINPLALNNPHLSYTSSVYSPQQTPTLVDPTPDHFSQAPAEAWVQPPSRFSVTTYATSAADATPRVSADHELPPLPTPPAQFESVMDRKRPVRLGSTSPAINTDHPFKISMASPYASSSGEASPSPTASRAQLPSSRATPRTPLPSGIRDSGRTDSMLSTTKALPLAPPELMSANDRVAHLNARLGALGNRRININTAIKQMTELMPQDNLMASEAVLRKREAEKRKVEALKTELADVQREEYELGLKLHRAYKRLDKNAEYEPTTLWVRRVTG